MNKMMAVKLRSFMPIVRRRHSIKVLIVCVVVVLVGYYVVNSFRGNAVIDDEQVVVNYIANNMEVNIQVLNNMEPDGTLKLTLTNVGYKHIQRGRWRIYFNCFGSFKTQMSGGLGVFAVNGGLFYLSPVGNLFRGISPGSSAILFLEGYKSISRTDFLPNWYVWSEKHGVLPAIIECTKDETLSFVGVYNDSSKWKRNSQDQYNPYTPRQRFKMHLVPKETYFPEHLNIVPTPVSVKILNSTRILIDSSWLVVKHVDTVNDIRSTVFAEKFGLLEINEAPPNGNYFEFVTNSNLDEEEYTIEVNRQSKKVTISSNGSDGAFYATQTLYFIMGTMNTTKSVSLPEMFIQDKPRFAYRGLMLDVARNFHSKDAILKLLDVMAMYKMNKLHLHLSDDEGWRIEIPGIPELTKYGSNRCYDSDICLKPSLGSGPFTTTPGSGFYSVSDYREILKYATKRYIQIIPEIDMPGHAMAAVFSMARREQNRQNSQLSSKSYLLTDHESSVTSVQGWTSNSINPCLNTTYIFVENLLSALKAIYNNVQPLDVVHFGGDEVPYGIWKSSPACRKLFHGVIPDHNTIKKMFIRIVGGIADKYELNVALWEDGAYMHYKPYDLSDLKPKKMFINTWNNVWNSGRSRMPMEFSDAGYKVILSMATHLYLDHPYEPDPEERGLYWATRFVDTYKVFGFIPMDILSNADADLYGKPIKWDKECPGGRCPRIKNTHNVLGVEACVWSETIRTPDQLFSMIFPRALAVAERSWHKGQWENIRYPITREKAKKDDWARFVKMLGETHLPILDKLGITYRVPPPGINLNTEKNVIEFNSQYPRHRIMVSFDNDAWFPVTSNIPIPKRHTVIRAKVLSPVLDRESRVISITVDASNDSTCLCSLNYVIYCLFCLLIITGF